jgi:dipeptidyl-peptidase-4
MNTIKSLAFLAVLLATFNVPAIAQQPPAKYTIADIFKHPGLTGFHPKSIEWSPNGKYVSFLLRRKGKKLADLHILNAKTGKEVAVINGKVLAGAAEPPSTIKNERKRDLVTRYGVNIYDWSPKGDFLIYSSHNQIYRYDPSSKKSTVITHETGGKSDPKISPNERWIAYVTNDDVHYVSINGGKVHSVAPHREQILNGGVDWVYREELDLQSGYAWSPDSTSIAFLQFNQHPVPTYPLVNALPHHPTVYEQKYPAAGDPNPIVRLGVHSIKTDETTWVKAAGQPDTYLPRFGWLPNGHRLYLTVLNRLQTHERLLTADPETGKTQTLLAETDPYWIDVTDNFHFFKHRDRFVWGTNRDGWYHLYLFDRKGNAVRDLTPGSFNVQKLQGVDEQHGWVYYTASPRTPLYTDLYRVSLNGGKPERVTEHDGTHSISMSPHAKHYLDTFSKTLRPPSIALDAANGKRVTLIQAAAKVSQYDFQKPEFFTILAADGKTKLYARMIKPPHFDPHKHYPVIMYQYGGPHARPVVRDAWGGSGAFFNQRLARQGFILFSVDNRAATYFSHRRQALIKHRFGKIELADQLAAVKWLKSKSFVDSKRIGIWGWSYGGYMTTYELTHSPGTWKAAIAVAPVTKWTDYDSIYTERYLGLPQNNRKGYRESSSVFDVPKLSDHLLLVAGTGDDNVHFQNSLQFIQAMIDAGKPFKLMIYPNKTHGISGTAARTHLFSMMDRFWLRELGNSRVH